ncbi:MAG: PQQ-like beta-propeller repeat protein [Planctomycetales bacterium]
MERNRWTESLASWCCLLVLSVGSGQAIAQQAGQDWPQLLGPNRNGISAETGLLKKWPADGPKEAWRVPGGVGMSAVSISQGRAVTMIQAGGKQSVIALDAKTGKQLWKTDVADEYRNSMGNGPRATPTIAGDAIYVFTGQGILAALKSGDGTLLWKQDVLAELGGKPAAYGMASSPLVVGDLVVTTAGTNSGCVVALARATGKVVWKTGSGAAGYSSPTLRTVGGTEQIVAFTGTAALGISPKSGDELWSYPYKTAYDCNIAVPLEFKGRVFISSGENHGSSMLSLQPSGDRFTVKETWTSHGSSSVLRNEWQTSMLLDGKLYGLDNSGSAGPITHLTCVDAADGKRLWQQGRFGKGNLIAADGKLFIVTIKGDLVVVRANPEKFEELGRAKILGFTRQAPSLANGLLYLRDDKEIVCLDVRE